MFSSLIKKPRMTEKHLIRPPFKYLYDIITEIRNVTGFGEGLYSDIEDEPAFYEGKKARKEFYLKKIITLTSLILGEEIEVNPAHIVAGIEPEKTNRFLQGMYRAATSKKESRSCVEKILDVLAHEELEIVGRSRTQQFKNQTSVKPNENDEFYDNPTPASVNINQIVAQDHGTFIRKVLTEVMPKDKIMEHDQGASKYNFKKPSEGRKTPSQQSDSLDIEVTQKYIQELSHISNPLKKIFDYVSDDVEALNKEMAYWRLQYSNSRIDCQAKNTETEAYLQPIKHKIVEMDECIQEKQIKIQMIKANILQHKECINNLLYSVV
jgi:hypothetical protein